MQNLPATGRQFSEPMKIDIQDLLGPKHAGMRISASGVIRNAMDAMANREGCEADRFMLSELERHLRELGIRFYSGDVLVVDEFLQLYALDQTRPKQLTPRECSGCGERKLRDKFPDDPAVPGLCAACDLLVRSDDEPLEVAHREEKQNEQDQ
jgi:hypothetical protein